MSVDSSPSMSRRTALTALIGLTTAACSKLAFLAVNAPAVFGSYSRRLDLPYGAGPHRTLDIYLPDKPANSRLPLIVFWYGGRWSAGDKSEYRFVGAALAGLGYVAVLPNYRHYPEVKMAGFMDDAARAALWAVDHAADFGADPRQLYLMGHSAGAHIAALAALDTRYFLATGRPVPHIAGLIGLSGPYDFLPLTDADLQDMFGPPDNYPNSQPINFVRLGAPRMLLVHGLNDDSVWPKNTVNLAAAATAKGIHVTLKLFPKLRHADTVAALSLPARGRAPILADIADFIGPVTPGRA